MNTAATPFVECEQIHAGLAVTDIAAAIDFYTKKLGFKLAFTWGDPPTFAGVDRKSTRLNSSHLVISYAVFCLKKKKQKLARTAAITKDHVKRATRITPRYLILQPCLT